MKIDEFDAMKDRFKFDGGINGKGEYFNSVILLLIIPIDGEYHLVFQKVFREVR